MSGNAAVCYAVRTFASAPKENPLSLVKKTSKNRRLCDENGVRLPRVQWVFQLAVAQPHTNPPSLKTVNFQRITNRGLDFIMKRPDGSGAPTTANVLTTNPPVSMLYTSGHFTPGDTEEQWRGEGKVEEIPIKDLVSVVPTYSLVGILASKRAQDELHKVEDIVSSSPLDLETEVHRTRIEKHSKFIELVQKTRADLENGNVSPDELEDSIMAFRLVPERLERMVGGPDHLVMDRWEWVAVGGLDTRGKDLDWSDPRHLLPF
jgi:hypothetical protein